MMRALLLLVMTSSVAFAQALKVPAGSVGVVYAESEQVARVVFPASTCKGLIEWSYGKKIEETTPIDVEGDLVFFDSKGAFGRIKPEGKAAARFWCENDGGTQFRPELPVKLSAGALSHKLSPIERLQKIAAFVVVAPKDPKKKLKLESVSWRATSDERVLDGDFDGDKKPEAVIYVGPDDAKNCDGKPQNNLWISLLAGTHDDDLRCCGP
jgi:hypothetical protein